MAAWDFLDKVNYNLLYDYAEVLKGGRQLQLPRTKSSETMDIREREIIEMKKNVSRKKRALYLIWVAYRYILNCPTYEDAKKFMNKDVLKELHLSQYIKTIYFGADDDVFVLKSGIIVPLHKVWCRKVEDIDLILEILYNRYDFYEQFECFIRHMKDARQSRAEAVYTSYKELERILCQQD